MSNYLVTGAAGFIGARLAEMLIQEEHTVTGVDNLNSAYDVRMKEHRLQKLRKLPGFTFHRLDVSERSLLQPDSPLGGQTFGAVLHLAARAGVRASTEDPWAFIDSNVTGTLNMLEFCRQTGIPKFVLASTSSIYGANPPLPTPEEACSDQPLQPYAATKKAAEALSHSYHYLYGLDVSVLRYFTVYGPAGRPDLAMFRFVQWISEDRPVFINGTGDQSRGFTYVDDIVRGTMQALHPLGYEIINLGGHEVVRINQLVAMLEEIIGQKARIEYAPPNPADMLTNWADVGKAGRLLGWQPQVSLQDGIRRLVDWYRAERGWANQVVTA